MPDSIVQQSGGDFTTLNAALQDAGTVAGDTITIQGLWTIDDTTLVTVSNENITVQIVAGDASYHDGVYNESNNHYRLVCSGGHCITASVGSGGFTLDGVAVVQDGIGVSDEGIRTASNDTTHNFKRCIIISTSDTAQQDGIYNGAADNKINNIENCILYRWGRCAILAQNAAIINRTQTLNINSCSIFDINTFTAVPSPDGGGISMRNTQAGFTGFVNVFNTIVLNGDVAGSGGDYSEQGSVGTVTWGISYSIDSDNSIASRDGAGAGNQPNRIATANPNPGVGDFVIWINITDDTQDLHLQDNPTDNDAQNAGAISAEGLTLPILDIDDKVRDRAINQIDIGADAFPPIMLPQYGQIIMQPTGPEYGQPLSETGDTFPQYGQIIKVDPKPLYAQEFLKEANDDQYAQRIVRD